MKLGRKKQIKKQFSFEPLASALNSSRASMLPMDFMIVDLSTDNFEKSATLACVQSYFGQSLHLSLSGYEDSILRGLFAPLLALGMNPNSEEKGFYYGEWKQGSEGLRQVMDLLMFLEQELEIPKRGRVQVTGPGYLYDQIRSAGQLLELATGQYELKMQPSV